MQKTHSTHGGSAFAQSVTKYYPQHGLKGSIYRRKPSACYAKSISRRLTNRKQRKREKKRKSSVTQQKKRKACGDCGEAKHEEEYTAREWSNAGDRVCCFCAWNTRSMKSSFMYHRLICKNEPDCKRLAMSSNGLHCESVSKRLNRNSAE